MTSHPSKMSEGTHVQQQTVVQRPKSKSFSSYMSGQNSNHSGGLYFRTPVPDVSTSIHRSLIGISSANEMGEN